MADLPVDRTTANTPAEHVADHNVLHATHNLIDGDGSNGQVLTRVGGVPTWAAPSGSTGELRWTLAAAQTIESGGGGENIVFDTEQADDLTIGAPGATWTVPTGGGGVWTLTSQVVFSAQVGANRAFLAIVVDAVRYVQPVGSGEDQASCSITVRLADGAVITPANVFQSSGSSKTATAIHQAFRIRP